MGQNVTELATGNWGISLTDASEVVTDLKDIAQCMAIIFNTRTGSDRLRPDFGTELWRWVDRPVDVAIPNVKLELIRGIQRWEPRAEILRITHVLDVSQVIFTVYWRSTITGETAETNFNLQLR